MMVTLQELEMLASLLARAGVTNIEAAWANDALNRLRQMAQAEKLRLKAEAALDSNTSPVRPALDSTDRPGLD